MIRRMGRGFKVAKSESPDPGKATSKEMWYMLSLERYPRGK